MADNGMPDPFATPDNYWDTPQGRDAAAWETANPGAGASGYNDYQNIGQSGNDALGSTTYRTMSAGGQGGAGSAIGFDPGWEYPVSDPSAAVRNYLSSIGQSWNPFNEFGNQALDEWSAGLLPQFLSGLLGQDSSNMQVQPEFGKFIAARGNGSIAAPTIGQAAQNIGNLNGALRGVAASIQGPLANINRQRAAQGLAPYNLSNPADRAAVMAQIGQQGGPGISPLVQAIAGLMPDSNSQAAMFLASYLPALGPAFSKGLGHVVNLQQRNAGDYLGRILGSQNKSFLDYLTGSLNI